MCRGLPHPILGRKSSDNRWLVVFINHVEIQTSHLYSLLRQEGADGTRLMRRYLWRNQLRKLRTRLAVRKAVQGKKPWQIGLDVWRITRRSLPCQQPLREHIKGAPIFCRLLGEQPVLIDLMRAEPRARPSIRISCGLDRPVAGKTPGETETPGRRGLGHRGRQRRLAAVSSRRSTLASRSDKPCCIRAENLGVVSEVLRRDRRFTALVRPQTRKRQPKPNGSRPRRSIASLQPGRLQSRCLLRIPRVTNLCHSPTLRTVLRAVTHRQCQTLTLFFRYSNILDGRQ